MSSVFPSSTGWITSRTTEVQLDSIMIFFRPHPTLENSKIGAVINASAFGFGNSLVFTGKTQDKSKFYA